MGQKRLKSPFFWGEEASINQLWHHWYHWGTRLLTHDWTLWTQEVWLDPKGKCNSTEYILIRIYEARSPAPPHPPPNGIPPPLLTPPTPPKPSILHVICTYTYTYTHIYSPFHPSNLASLRSLQHLRATTSSTDLVYLYISIITFFSNRL